MQRGSGAREALGQRQALRVDALQLLQQVLGIGILRQRFAHGDGAGVELVE